MLDASNQHYMKLDVSGSQILMFIQKNSQTAEEYNFLVENKCVNSLQK